MAWTHRTLIVPTNQVELARSLCAALAGPAGEGMFTTPLSPTGFFPATHYISSGYIFDDFAALLPLTTATQTVNGEREASTTETTRPGNVAFVEGLAAQAGITLPAGTIAALFDAIDVTELGPWEAMARLGLVQVVALPPKAASASEWAAAHGEGRGAVIDMPGAALAVPSGV